jgi:hypothetical protein
MALRGKGALAIWNGIADGVDADFVEWHVKEHMPERVGLPGFLSGRRYTAIDGHPAYFNFYEVEDPDVLRAAAYLARLNDPSPWTKRVIARFTDMSRTLCRVTASVGIGAGGFAEVIRFSTDITQASALAYVRGLAKAPGICGAHFFLCEEGQPQVTSETKLRGAADITWAGILIVETATQQAAFDIRADVVGDEALAAAHLGLPAGRGLYRLDYLIHHQDVADAGTSRSLYEDINE